MGTISNSDWIRSVKIKMLSGEIVEFNHGKNNVIILRDDGTNNVRIIIKDESDQSFNKSFEYSSLPMEKEYYTISELRNLR